MNNKYNYNFKPKSREEHIEQYSLEAFYDEKLHKYNFIKKSDGSLVSDVWFNNIRTWEKFSLLKNEEYDKFRDKRQRLWRLYGLIREKVVK